jgi:hypothetical protein
MNFHSTTASFTVSTEPGASLSCANLPTDSAFYDVSVRRLIALLQASSPQSLAALQLPFASNCCTLYKHTEVHLQGTYTPLVHAHAGRTHQFAPDANSLY